VVVVEVVVVEDVVVVVVRGKLSAVLRDAGTAKAT